VITLPVLFKKTSTGAIQTWSIGVEDNVIIVNHGKQGGKIQRTEETIKEGKSIGRSNETTPAEQALAEATSKWEGKIKKGYVEEVERAEAGEKDIDGGFDCMLAHKFSDHNQKITYPAAVQPKLNGHRCLAVVKDGVATLWSRTRKPITSCPHIVKELEAMYPSGYNELDGELYNHSYKNKFEELASLIRQEVPAANHTEVEYHVYDRPLPGKGFAERYAWLENEVAAYDKKHGMPKYIKLVETTLVNNEDSLMTAFEHFLHLGYEGAMARNVAGDYQGKRSYNLQKVKEFLDDDWVVIDVEQGRGSYAKCGIFVCRIAQAKHSHPCICSECAFRVKMRGPKEQLMEFWKNPVLYRGKKLVVKYQYISKYGVPIFPVGERWSDK
jgi:DNA ligase-1